jgi:transposase
MSARFVNIDRETGMLLPVDLRDWVANDDLAHFILDALALVDLSAAACNQRGTGSEQYPPGMMLGVLIYCYAQGFFSSRVIERATYQHLAVRYLAGNTHPDHDTIASFRRQNGALLRSVFVQLLALARRSGLLRLGAVALDGTKLKAAASRRRTLSLAQIDAELGELEKSVGELLDRAEAADANSMEQEQLPAELTDAQARRERLRAAKLELEQQARERHAQREPARAAAPVPPRGRPKPVAPEAKASDRINLSDPQSALTPTAQEGFIQGYNAQLAVSLSEAGSVSLIVAAEVVRETSDIQQLAPMTDALVANVGVAPAVVLADTGYDHTPQIIAVQQRDGVRVLCPPARSAQARADRLSRPYRWERERHAVRESMRERLRQPHERALYRRRSTSIEPVFGIIKNALGFRRFALRGLEKTRLEWNLVSLAFNCRRLAAARKQRHPGS